MKTIRNRPSFISKAGISMNNCGRYRPPVIMPNASDGNPVRHSLLNLVAEEDIPELLQAMAEEVCLIFV
uniref:Uncharacterized protein n=1 Tax=Panagrolaimus sp. ES5 TaxID=591445 RepID=A0AC34GS24_9BILA